MENENFNDAIKPIKLHFSSTDSAVFYKITFTVRYSFRTMVIIA